MSKLILEERVAGIFLGLSLIVLSSVDANGVPINHKGCLPALTALTPIHLKPQSAAWFDSVMSVFELAPHHVHLLTLTHAASQKLDQKSKSNEILELRLHLYFANSILFGTLLETLHAHLPYNQIAEAPKQCLLSKGM